MKYFLKKFLFGLLKKYFFSGQYKSRYFKPKKKKGLKYLIKKKMFD
jgi:hypothetical protein